MSFWNPICDVIKLTSNKEKNKYQAALDRLYSLRNGIKNDYPFRKFDRETMKESLLNGTSIDIEKDKHTLQELIDKTVPKKIHISRIGMGICSANCPVCEEEVMFSEDDLEKYKTLYCIYCGQSLEEE